MQPVKTDHPPGFVGVISGDLSRFAAFMLSMLKLQVPPDTHWNWVRGNGFASNRNELLRSAFQAQPNLQWVWMVDDDHDFQAGLLIRLLKNARDSGCDIMQTIVSTRKPPYRPYAYRWTGTEYETLRWDQLEVNCVNFVDAVGAGGMLIQRPVLDAIGDPWFTEGKIYADSIGEDLYFCTKAREAGFTVGVDCGTPMGHLSVHSVRPQADKDGKWSIGLDLDNNMVATMPLSFCEPPEVKA